MDNTKPLKNKVILVTGASSGIGAATAMEFDRAGAKVAMAARRTVKLESLALRMHDPLVLTVDLSDELAAREMVVNTARHFGQIDVIIHNAAAIIVAESLSVTSGDLLSAVQTNLAGPVAATQEAVRIMLEKGSGHIINVGSPGFMMGIPYYAPYVCSKAAFSAWTRTIQSEWAGSGIMVSEYFPGYIRTGSQPESRIGEVEQDLLMAEDQSFITRLFTRPLSPEDVARQLVQLVIKPRTLAFSGFGVRIGTFIAQFPGFRMAIATQMARTARTKLNISTFASSKTSQ